MRLNTRRSVSLIVAGTVGLAGAAGVYWSAWQTVTKIKMVPAVIVTRAVGQTETVPADAVAVRQVPDTALPPGALDDPGEVFGKTTARPLVAGQFLTKADLASDLLRRGLASDEVGVAVKMPPETGSVLRPGDLVNVIAAPKLQIGAAARSPVVLMIGKRIVALYDATGAPILDRSGVASVVSAVANAGRIEATAAIPAFAVLALAPEESLTLRDGQRTADIYLDLAPWSTSPLN